MGATEPQPERRQLSAGDEACGRHAGRPLERRLLQATVALGCLVPLAAGGAGMLKGAAMIKGLHAPPIDLDSHFRYLSGLLFGIGIAFASCVPAIERRGSRFQTLGAIVIVGGLARLLSLVEAGRPSGGHLFGLAMELGAVPLLLLWQARLVRSGIDPKR